MCLYELLSGHFPFPIDLDDISNKPPAALPAYVPAFFADVVMRMLEKAPE